MQGKCYIKFLTLDSSSVLLDVNGSCLKLCKILKYFEQDCVWRGTENACYHRNKCFIILLLVCNKTNQKKFSTPFLRWVFKLKIREIFTAVFLLKVIIWTWNYFYCYFKYYKVFPWKTKEQVFIKKMLDVTRDKRKTFKKEIEKWKSKKCRKSEATSISIFFLLFMYRKIYVLFKNIFWKNLVYAITFVLFFYVASCMKCSNETPAPISVYIGLIAAIFDIRYKWQTIYFNLDFDSYAIFKTWQRVMLNYKKHVLRIFLFSSHKWPDLHSPILFCKLHHGLLNTRPYMSHFEGQN